MARPTRSVVTEAERSMAADLVADWSGELRDGTRLSSADQLHLLGMLTAALADARDGATIPGERQLVYAVLDVPVTQWRTYRTHQAYLRERLRRTWAAKLQAEGLRPLGWPPVTTTYLRWSWADGDPGATAELPDLEHADLVRLTIRGHAVPA